MFLPCSPWSGYNQFLRIDAILNSQPSVKLNSLHAERVLAAVRECSSAGKGQGLPAAWFSSSQSDGCQESEVLPSVAAMVPCTNPKLESAWRCKAFEVAGTVLTRSLLSICQYELEVHPMDFFIFLFFGWAKKILFGKVTFPLVCLPVWNNCNNMPGTCREQMVEKSPLR